MTSELRRDERSRSSSACHDRRARRFDTDELLVYHLVQALRASSGVFPSERHDVQRSIGISFPVFQRYFMMPGSSCDTTLRVGGAEALFRWRFDDGDVEPSSMFDILSRFPEQLVELTKTMIRWACWSCASWLRHSHVFAPSVSVNVPVSFLAYRDAYETVRDILEEVMLPASALIFEVTEQGSGFSSLERCASSLQALSRMGIRFVVDDFGKGFSTMDRCLSSCISGVKLDGSFLRGRCLDAQTLRILKHIVRFFQRFGREIIIECVEEDAEARALFEQFCCWKHVGVQGYYYHRPEAYSACLSPCILEK